MATRSISIILFCGLLIILSGCDPRQDKLLGQWLNLNNSSQSDLILWNIEGNRISTVNGGNQLRIWPSERTDDHLMIEGANGINERFLIELKGSDTLILKGDLGSEHFLIRLDAIAPCKECNARAKYDSLRESLIGKTWVSQVLQENNAEKHTLLEFKEKNKALFYSYVDGEYKYSNVLEWDLLYQGSSAVLILRGIMNSYLFLNSISPAEIQGMTFSTGKWNPEGVQQLNRIQLEGYTEDRIEQSIDIVGNWRSMDNDLFKVPNELYISKSVEGLKIDFIYKNPKQNSSSKLDLNLFQNLLLLNDLNNGRMDVLELLEYKNGRITIKWKGGREVATFEKYNSDYFID